MRPSTPTFPYTLFFPRSLPRRSHSSLPRPATTATIVRTGSTSRSAQSYHGEYAPTTAAGSGANGSGSSTGAGATVHTPVGGIPNKPPLPGSASKYNAPQVPNPWGGGYQSRTHPGGRPPLGPSQPIIQKRPSNPVPQSGSFLHWFMTTKWIHMCITLGTLCTLGIVTFHLEFRRKSPYANMLPPMLSFFGQPITFVQTYVTAFKLDVEHTSAITAERRRKKADDVRKRAEYRKAHGLDQNQGFGGWTSKEVEESHALREKQREGSHAPKDRESAGGATPDQTDAAPSAAEQTHAAPSAAEASEAQAQTQAKDEDKAKPVKTVRKRMFVDSQGNKRELKMWLGIW